MNTIKRKANSVQMNNNDHRDVKGGLRRLRRPRLLITAAALACVAVVPLAAGAAANRPSLGAADGLQNFKLRLDDARTTAQRPASPDLLADAVVRVGARARRDALRVRALDEQELRRRQRPHLVEQDRSRRRRPPFRSRCRGSPATPRRCTGASARSAAVRSRRGASRRASTCAGPTCRTDWRPTSRVAGADGPGYVRWTPSTGRPATRSGSGTWTEGDSDRQGRLDDHDRRRRARVLHAARCRRRTSSGASAPGATSTARTQNGLPSVSYGPWSDDYTATVARAGVQTPTTDVATAAQDDLGPVRVRRRHVQAHALMPAFVFSHDGHALASRLHRDRQGLRQHRPRRFDRRRHRLRAARQRPARAQPREVEERDAAPVPAGRVAREDDQDRTAQSVTSNETLRSRGRRRWRGRESDPPARHASSARQTSLHGSPTRPGRPLGHELEAPAGTTGRSSRS